MSLQWAFLFTCLRLPKKPSYIIAAFATSLGLDVLRVSHTYARIWISTTGNFQIRAEENTVKHRLVWILLSALALAGCIVSAPTAPTWTAPAETDRGAPPWAWTDLAPYRRTDRRRP